MTGGRLAARILLPMAVISSALYVALYESVEQPASREHLCWSSLRHSVSSSRLLSTDPNELVILSAALAPLGENITKMSSFLLLVDPRNDLAWHRRRRRTIEELVSGRRKVQCSAGRNTLEWSDGMVVEQGSRAVVGIACELPPRVVRCVRKEIPRLQKTIDSELAGVCTSVKLRVRPSGQSAYRAEDAGNNAAEAPFLAFIACYTEAARRSEFSMATAITRQTADLLPQWLSYHKFLGAERFYIYLLDDEATLKKKILKNSPGKITLIPWIGSGRDEKLWTGEARAVNPLTEDSVRADCIYRFRQHTAWLLYSPVDEYLFLKANNSIPSSELTLAKRIGLNALKGASAARLQRVAFSRLLRTSGENDQQANRTLLIASSVTRCETNAIKDQVLLWHPHKLIMVWKGGVQAVDTSRTEELKKVRINDYSGRHNCKLTVFDMGARAALERSCGVKGRNV